VHRVSAWQDGAGGSIRVGGGAPVPLPPNGAAAVSTDQIGLGAAAPTVEFLALPVGGGGYVIELTE
jgi:hypothetical protein